MNLQKKPFVIDFIGNNPEFVIRTSPYLTAGRRYSRTFAITSLTAGTLTMSTPHGDLTFTVQAAASKSALVIQSATTIDNVYVRIVDKIKYNDFLNTYYDIVITKEAARVTLKLTDKEYAACTDITMTSSGSANEISTISTTTGLNRVQKEKYKIDAKFEITQNGTSKQTPHLYYHDNDGKVTIGTKLLSPYFSERDIPGYRESVGAYSCGNNMLVVKLLYAESIDGSVGYVAQSEDIKLVNGELEKYERDNNIPDWNPAVGGKFHQSSSVDIFGQDNAAIVRTGAGTEQWLYVHNYAQAAKTGTLTFTLTYADGTSEVKTCGTLQLPIGVSRIPTGLYIAGTLSQEVVSYTADISVTGQNSITRTYVIISEGYHARTLLLLNKLNLYESFMIQDVAKEIITEGESTVTKRRNGYTVNDESVVYTARTGLRTLREIKAIEYALGKEGNLMLDGTYAHKISIQPNSYAVYDEAEDLLGLEFQFKITEKINRQPEVIPSITASEVISYTDTLIQ